MSTRDNKRPLKNPRAKLTMPTGDASHAASGGNPLIDNIHDYTTGSVTLPVMEDLTEEFPPLSLSPRQSPAPKKPMLSSKVEDIDVVASLSKLINERMDGLALQLDGVKKTVDFACEEIKDVKKRVGTLENRMTKEESRMDTHQQHIFDLERYSRRWNLRLLGVKENEKNDVCQIAIEICQAVLPECKNRIRDTVDTVHRSGAKLPNSSKPRPILIQFISRVTRDSLWKAAKTSQFLKDNHWKFAEDLSNEDRERRNKLWPIIEKARSEGKKAYYVGCRGFVNGTEIFPSSG